MVTHSATLKTTNAATDEEGWGVLFYYNLYRLGLTIFLLLIASSRIRTLSLNETSLTLTLPIAGIALMSVLTMINLQRRWPALAVQAHLLFMLDIAFISILTFSRHLPDLSTVIFYVTIAASSAVLFRAYISLLYTGFCAGLILFNDYLRYVSKELVIEEYYLTPLLIVGLFSVVVIVSSIAKRTRRAESMVQEQEQELADLDQINQYIVGQLELGVMFLDQKLNIQFINESARNLVGEFISQRDQVVGELANMLSAYVNLPQASEFSFQVENQELGFSALPLGSGYLVQIEDRSRMQREIQETKLASVGRMASAISHEIRNPLSAINHAAQLLTPKSDDVAEDTELIQIIRSHAKRIDEIIESVLQRSQPGQAQLKELALQPWLKVFISTFEQTLDIDNIELSYKGEDAVVLFDPTQLEQVITNLCQNSIKYAKPESGKLKIRFYVSKKWDNTPRLDITDNGQGIAIEDVDKLFEPFQTTDAKSTGLGLFLVKEFCDNNQANIEYLRGSHRHGFRITFSQPVIEQH